MTEQQEHRLRRGRTFRPRRNVLEELDDAEVIKRYRLDRAGIMFVVELDLSLL